MKTATLWILSCLPTKTGRRRLSMTTITKTPDATNNIALPQLPFAIGFEL